MRVMEFPRSRGVRRLQTRFRQARMLARAFQFAYRPVAAHLIVTRRCNLSCTYCNEYDDHSPPVPAEVLIDRIDALARLGTAMITLTGGEPLLHPKITEIVRHVRSRGICAEPLTNAYLLT